MPEIEKAVSDYKLNEYYDKALRLVISGRAREAFDIAQEPEATRDMYGRNTFGQSCLLARRLVEAGTRVVEVIWPKVANSDNHSWDHHVGLSERMKNQSGPMLDAGLSGLITDLDRRGMLKDTLVVAVGEFGRSPQKGVSTSGNGNSADGRDHWPYCYTAVMAGAGIRGGYVHGKSDKTGSAPAADPVHPANCWRRSITRSGSTPPRSSTTTSSSLVSWSRPTPWVASSPESSGPSDRPGQALRPAQVGRPGSNRPRRTVEKGPSGRPERGRIDGPRRHPDRTPSPR